MKRLLLLLCFTLAVAGCAPAGSLENDGLGGFDLSPDDHIIIFSAKQGGISSIFAKTDGLNLVGPVSANGDAAKQATDITTLLNEGVKALVINPVDSAAIATSVAAAKAKG